MRAHVVESGVVTNTIEVNKITDLPNLVAAVGSEGIGWTYDGSTFTDPNALSKSESDAIAAVIVRRERNDYLMQSDWTQNRDVTLSNDADWKTYRQALRDVPTQSGFPGSVTWPTKPS
tara:strand:+ start:689 stop:1042 length:354 start_codon:yes stop_codon:yes gene_type:complete